MPTLGEIKEAERRLIRQELMLPAEDMIGKYVADAMLAYLRRAEEAHGIYPVCDGAFFVTKPETIQALRRYFEEVATFMGIKIMAPKGEKHATNAS